MFSVNQHTGRTEQMTAHNQIRAKCFECGQEIYFDGKIWRHHGIAQDHAAVYRKCVRNI